MTNIKTIPLHVLIQDIISLENMIELGKTALDLGMTEYELVDGVQSVSENINRSNEVLQIITLELQRRKGLMELPPRGEEIIAYALYRGLEAPGFDFKPAFGWSLICTLKKETQLLWNICEECKIIHGGGSTRAHQIKPEQFVLPDPSTLIEKATPGEDLYGKA